MIFTSYVVASDFIVDFFSNKNHLAQLQITLILKLIEKKNDQAFLISANIFVALT